MPPPRLPHPLQTGLWVVCHWQSPKGGYSFKIHPFQPFPNEPLHPDAVQKFVSNSRGAGGVGAFILPYGTGEGENIGGQASDRTGRGPARPALQSLRAFEDATLRRVLFVGSIPIRAGGLERGTRTLQTRKIDGVTRQRARTREKKVTFPVEANNPNQWRRWYYFRYYCL